MNIKPIKTRYKGYMFRSRTEARWAVAFDSIGLQWRYEVEGYNIPKVGPYLIDFYLPKQPRLRIATYVEIKGELPTEVELEKAHGLSDLLGAPVLMLCDMPGDQHWFLYYDKYFFSSTKNYSRESWWSFIGMKTSKKQIALAYEAARSARFEHGQQP